MKMRCQWGDTDPLYRQYHDNEWGVPEHDDRKLFELLILEGAQAGLSWLTILRKRENYRNAFDNFDAEKIALYDDIKIRELLSNAGIVRNRLKILATVDNAKAFMEIQEDFGSFDSFIWQFVNNRPKKNAWKTVNELPSRTAISDSMSRELKRRSFKFIGSTICYAYMQAVGMVNDHVVDCFRYKEIN